MSAFYTVVSYVGHYLTARVIATLCVSFCLFVFSAAVMAAGMLHQRSPFFYLSFHLSFHLFIGVVRECGIAAHQSVKCLL